MLVRLGYVALSLDLKNCSPNKTTTWKNLQKVDPQHRISKLRLLAKENLNNQLRLLKYNLAEEIQVYRFTSKLVPLATHESAAGWSYETNLAEEFHKIGEFVRENKMRVSFHPDHFVNLNSPSEDVVNSSLIDLSYHLKQALAMGLDQRMKFNIHIGGAYQDKEQSIERFINKWPDVPKGIQERITLENDDKTYTAIETLSVCQKLKIPMVLDIHHHRCNHGEDSLSNFLADIFATWNHSGLAPKIHLSSPKGTESPAAFRSHADNIEPNDLLPFLDMAKRHLDELDIMIEAKNKDVALKKLMQDLSGVSGLSIVDGASFRVH